VRDGIQAAVDREQFGYPLVDAATGVPQATALWSAQRYGWDIDPDRIHVLPDVLTGVELAIEVFSPAGSPVILHTPAYMPFFEVAKVTKRPLIEVPMLAEDGKFVLDLEGIDVAFGNGARTLILCNPYNPLGRAFAKPELAALAAIVDRHGARVIADEIHAPITYDGVHVPYASVADQAASHSLTFVSASKAWNLPGLKCAQAIVTSDADEDVWQTISTLRTHGASTIGIAATVAAYGSGASWLDETLAYLDENRRLLDTLVATHLPGVNYRVPEATYLAWLDLTDLELPSEPAAFFLEYARVGLNPGISFGGPGKGCVRLNFATSAELLTQAVAAMGVALKNS
jgi:cystathionine beta-lyase